ncbi:MAG: polysaccharide deacetylase family protein [Bryobacteraceae bacterium]
MYITTSWDDGHPLDLRVAELLHKNGLPGTFYIPIQHRFPLLTHRQIRELVAAGFEIGGHTVNHCDLLTVSDVTARREIGECKQELEQISGQPCAAFCFPKGHFRRHHVRAVAEAGFRSARTVELMSVANPLTQDGVAMLATTMQALDSRLPTFARNSVKRLQLGNLLRYIRFSKSDWVGTAAAVLRHVSEHGKVFHLWGHSWGIENRGQWENVDTMFRILGQCKREAIFVTNSELAEIATRCMNGPFRELLKGSPNPLGDRVRSRRHFR